MLVIAMALAACGRDTHTETTTAAETAGTCSPVDVDWSLVPSDTQKTCSNGFEYQSRCCDFGLTACSHAHKFVDYSEAFRIYGTNCWQRSKYKIVCDFAPCDGTRDEVANILDRVKARNAAYIKAGAKMDADPTFTAASKPYVLRIEDASKYTGGGREVFWGPLVGTQDWWPTYTPYHMCAVTIRGALVPHWYAPTDESVLISLFDTFDVKWGRTYDGGQQVNPPYPSWGYDAVCNPQASKDVNGNYHPRTYAACSAAGGANSDGSSRQYVSSATFCPTLPKTYTSQMTLAQFMDPAQSGVEPSTRTWADGSKAWRCMSGEELVGPGASTTDGYWQGKWTALKSLLDGFPAEGAVPKSPQAGTKRNLIQHLQFAFELHGNQLTPGQRDEAEGLYQRWDAANNVHITPSDGVPTAGGIACGVRKWMNYQQCAAAAGGTQVMCSRLYDNLPSPAGHVPAAVADAVVDKCAKLGSAVKALSSTCPAAYASTAAEYGRVSTELMRYLFPSIPDTGNAAGRQAKLQRNLALTGEWYEHRRVLEPDKAVRLHDAEIVAGAIVKSVTEHTRQALSTAAAVATRDGLIEQSGADHRDLLSVLLPASGTPPLRNAPALYVLAGALRPHAARVNEADYVHDFGCRFQRCGPSKLGGSDYVQSRTSQMHDALARLADPVALSTAQQMMTELPEWGRTFARLSTNYDAVFKPAALDARYDSPDVTANPYTPALVLDAMASDGPLWTMASIVRPAREKTASYKASGRFNPGEASALYTGLTGGKLTAKLVDAEGMRQKLKTAHQDYDRDWLTTINNLNLIQTYQGREQNARAQLGVKLTQLAQYGERIDGLRVAATVDLERFGDFGKAYEQMARKLDTASPARYVLITDRELHITPVEGRYTGGPVHNLAEFAVRDNGPVWSMPVVSNDLLRVEVDAGAAWSPTCAIAADRTFQPPLGGYLGAMTGPQGFGVTTSSSSFTSEVKTTTESDFNRADFVGGAGALIGGAIGGGPGASIGSTLGSALGGLHGGSARTSTSASSGTETRRTAAFNAGLRLATTPFPEYPVGSLLLALIDSQGAVVDIQVVQAPSTTIVIPLAADGTTRRYMTAYLAVNDRYCERSGDLGALGVHVQRMQPLSGFATALQEPMAKAEGYVRDQVANKLLRQGVILPSDLGTIRSQALSYLQEQANYADLSMLNGSGVQLFNAWIDTALNQAERQVEIERLLRETVILGMEAQALASEIEAIGRQSELLALLPDWSIGGIDQTVLKSGIHDLVEEVDRFLVPFARAKYPEVLDGVPEFAAIDRGSPAFASLTTGLDWSRDWGDVADRLAKDGGAADAVLARLRAAQRQLEASDSQGNPVYTTKEIIVAIPRPERFWNVANGEADAMSALGLYSGMYRELPLWDAEQVWSALTEGRPAKIQIPPELVYRASSEAATTGTLACREASPVIQHMALYAADTGTSVNGARNAGPAKTILIHASQSQLYATQNGPVAFQGTLPRVSFSTPMYWGKESSAYDYYSGRSTDTAAPKDLPARYLAANGLSPFGTFTLEADRANLVDPPQVYALLLIMTVEFRNTTLPNSHPNWVARCR